MKLVDTEALVFSRMLWRYNNADAARGRRTMLYPRSSDVQMFNQIYHIKTNFKEENMKKNITLNGSDFAEICPEISCLKLVQFDKAAYLLYIFRISRFDNRKKFQNRQTSMSERNLRWNRSLSHSTLPLLHRPSPILPIEQKFVFCFDSLEIQKMTLFFVCETKIK